MTNDRLELSRRTVLAGLGGVGVASTGAGLGTSAYFTDTESFEENRLTAGTLDMKVGWAEHYSDGSPDELADIPETVDVGENTLEAVLPSRPARRAGRYTGFPIGAHGGAGNDQKHVWILDDVVGTFMGNTAVEAYPDDGADDGTADDGIQDAIATICGAETDLADALDDLDPTADSSARTAADYQSNDVGRAEATYDSESGTTLPLVFLEDLKPGDFGEITFTVALCDNPGYLWLTGGGVDELIGENGTTEPEAASDAEGEGVELLDEIQVALWHDHDCDNLRDRAFRPPWHEGGHGHDGDGGHHEGEEAVHGGIDGDGGVEENELWINPETGERLPDERGARGTAITSLREFLNALEPETDGEVGGLPLDGDADTDGRDCFPARDESGNQLTHCIGLSWWLPEETGNEVQSDSVGFDLGFYAEQCRHNDGSGSGWRPDDDAGLGPEI